MVKTIERRRVVRDPDAPAIERRETEEVVTDESTDYVEPIHADIVPGWAIVVRRVIYYVLGLIEILLAFRFLLKLFAANPASPFVSFVYGMTAPLVYPFAGVFRGFETGAATFEPGTLLAIAVFAVLAWVIDRLVMLLATAERNV